jgi:hypothetical protein
MEKDSIFKLGYRFFDLIILTYLVFGFGYSINESYKEPRLWGLVAITLGLLAFNIYKFKIKYYNRKDRRNIAIANKIINL